MKNTFGSAVSVTIFGESHGAQIGAVVDGLAPGLSIDEDFIRHQLTLRRPSGSISTARQEQDAFQIVSGVYQGRTTGTPVCILIPNADTRSGDYHTNIARPGHADYSAQCKYHGAQDGRGGGHFSGRITAALVAAGALVIPTLRQKGIDIGTHILRCASVSDVPLDTNEPSLRTQLQTLANVQFAVLDSAAGERMTKAIEAARADRDSVGGILETAVVGLPAGLGEPWFDSLESLLSHALFSIPAVKGVEFGDGFEIAKLRGSRSNDPFCMAEGQVITASNHCGGILGGITNGMPLILRAAFKPTPSIGIEQDTVDLRTMTNTTLTIHGRHDPCIVHRAVPCVEAAVAVAVYDAFLQRKKER